MLLVSVVVMVACAKAEPGPTAAEPERPVEPQTASDVLAVESVTEDRLDVKIDSKTVALMDGQETAWVYVTDGLAAYGQAELVFALVRRPEEDMDAYPRNVLDVLAAIEETVRAGQQVPAWGRVRLR